MTGRSRAWLAGLVGLAAALGLATLAAPPAVGLVSLGQPAPEVAGTVWINSGPLTMAGLRGRVVLVEFWTYG